MYSNIFPLGKMSKNQLFKGFRVLKAIKKEIKTTKNPQKLLSLSNQFYINIPHINIKLLSTLNDIDDKTKLLNYMYTQI
tara:strand:+ start:2644 stop:2880 length:237 start_codon:yes stop_codon:yes gene_type:complete